MPPSSDNSVASPQDSIRVSSDQTAEKQELAQRDEALLPTGRSMSDADTKAQPVTTDSAAHTVQSIPPNEANEANEKPIESAPTPRTPAQPYSAFSYRQKWTIVALGSLAGIFGPISSNIYVPAIPQVVDQFKSTTQTIDLTLTIYL